MEKEDPRRPQGELCKVQFSKVITFLGKVVYDEKTSKYHIEGIDHKTGLPINSWVDHRNVIFIEDANRNEREKFERYASSLGKRPRT